MTATNKMCLKPILLRYASKIDQTLPVPMCRRKKLASQQRPPKSEQ